MSDVWVNTGTDEIAPCPFCQGRKLSIYMQRRLRAVQCSNCGAVGPTGHSHQEAVTLWNEQPQLAAATQRAEAAEAGVSEYAAKLDLALKRFGEKQSAWLAEKRRAEAAEAQLAAVPVDALWRYLRYAQVPEHHHRYIEDQQEADRAAISAWLAAQPEAQP